MNWMESNQLIEVPSLPQCLEQIKPLKSISTKDRYGIYKGIIAVVYKLYPVPSQKWSKYVLCSLRVK